MLGPWGKRQKEQTVQASLPEEASTVRNHQDYPCQNCGATLHYAPGTEMLGCGYCGAENEIVAAKRDIYEYDYLKTLRKKGKEALEEVLETIHCESCGANFTLPPTQQANLCPFCASPVVLSPQLKRHIRPEAVVPFQLSKDQATRLFTHWVKGLWFAPTKIKHIGLSAERLKGIYIPYWTYDSQTYSRYRGQRGTYYMVRQGDRMVQRVRWTPVSGHTQRFFDDVLVLGTDLLPPSITTALEPWNLQDLKPYTNAYLSGFQAEFYTVLLEEGFEVSKRTMNSVIRSDVRAHIGGHTQQIQALDSNFEEIYFKHILLPTWSAAYKYRGRTYHFVINAQTGKVQGERPWSVFKIGALVILGLILATLLFTLTRGNVYIL